MLDVPKLDPDDSRPHYMQVADALREAINEHRLRPGEKLPGHEAAAMDYGVSVSTIKRAYGLLSSEGIIVTRQGQGAFVRTQPLDAFDGDQADLRWEVTDIRRRLKVVEQRLDGLGG